MSDRIDAIKANLRAEFIGALEGMQLEHKVSVRSVIDFDGGKIDYSSDTPLSVKSAKLTRKTDKETGANFYELKVVVD